MWQIQFKTTPLLKRCCHCEISFLVSLTTIWAALNNSNGIPTNNFRALQYEEALKCTKLALQYESLLEKGNEALNDSAGTIVNMCVILSKLGQ